MSIVRPGPTHYLAMPVRWTESALEYMEGFQDYIAKDSSFYVLEADDGKDARELIFQGYQIIYFLQAAVTLLS